MKNLQIILLYLFDITDLLGVKILDDTKSKLLLNDRQKMVAMKNFVKTSK